MKKESFPKKKRVHSRVEFKRILDFGKKTHTSSFIIFTFPSDRNQNRLGISISKRVGKAHERNRIRRIIREVFRKHCFNRSVDYLFLVKPKAAKKRNNQIFQELEYFFNSLIHREDNACSQ